VIALLGVDSMTVRKPRKLGPDGDFQSLRILYEGRTTGGELRPEADGSTDLAAWHPLDAVPGLDRVALVDIGLELWRERPPLGRVDGHDPAKG
jgi:8-oxo-dGTP diphosphatase